MGSSDPFTTEYSNAPYFIWRYGAEVPKVVIQPGTARKGDAGILGRDAVPFWWYGAAALLVVGSVATFILIRPSQRSAGPGATLGS